MFETDESVNYLLNYSKKLVDNATSGYNYCERLKEMQYLVFAGMVAHYGFDNIKEIYEAFRCKVNFLSRDDLINNRYSEIDDDYKEMMLSGTVPTFTDIYLSDDSNPFLGIINVVNSIYIYYNPNFIYNSMLEALCHEENHIVNSINRQIVFYNGKINVRTGLCSASLFEKSNQFLGLEEGINQLQTNDIMNEIINFTKFKIDDSMLSVALDKVRNCHYDSTAYRTILNEIRPIYISPSYKNIILPNRLNGNIENIYNDFNHRLGEDKFMELSTGIDNLVKDKDPFSYNRYKVKQLVNTYISK